MIAACFNRWILTKHAASLSPGRRQALCFVLGAARLLRLRSQLTRHTQPVPLRYPTPRRDLAIREVEGTLRDIQSIKHLDFPLARRSCRSARRCKSLGQIRAPHRSTVLSVLPRHPRKLEREELEFRPYTRRLRGFLQHVCAVWQYHCY